MSIGRESIKMPIDHKEQAKPFVKQQINMIRSPTTMKEIPPNRWLFFQVISFFILHLVRKPIAEFIRIFGIIFPQTIMNIPSRIKIS